MAILKIEVNVRLKMSGTFDYVPCNKLHAICQSNFIYCATWQSPTLCVTSRCDIKIKKELEAASHN